MARCLLLLTMLGLMGLAYPASGANHAFVVGVDVYDNLGADKQLAKATGDARAIAATLRDLGFSASATENPRRSEFSRAWSTFLGKVQPGDTVAVFFSGHGVQVGGLNYFLPRDVPKVGAGDEGLLRDESVSLQKLLDDLKEKRPRLSLVIVDACRDNPFALAGTRSVGAARGLTRHDLTPEGTFVMLSAGAGEAALDRMPGNDTTPTSVYTRSLLPLLKNTNLTLQEMAVQVRDDVRKLASTIGHKQTPAYWDELTGPRICLAGPCGAAITPSAGPRRDDTPKSEPSGQTGPGGTGSSNNGPVTVPPGSLPPPAPRGPLAKVESDGLTFAVEQAARQRDRIAVSIQVKSGKSGRIGVAYDASIRTPENQYITYAASLTTGDGRVCYAKTVDGLEELDLSSARNFGGQGFSKDRVDRAMTALGSGDALALSLQFVDCTAGDSGRVLFVLHKLEGEKLEKVNVALPAFQISR